MTPLHICAVDGYSQLATLLLSYHADPEIKDKVGRTPLYRAVEHRKIEVILALIKGGADLNTTDQNQETPLIMACRKGFEDVVKFLLDNGADLTVKNFISNNCLHVAAKENRLEVFKLLLEKSDRKLLSALDIFDQTVFHHAARQKDIRLIDQLIYRGCCPETQDALGSTPLHVAAKYGSYETVKRLAGVVSDINVQNYDSKSAFFCACEIGNRETISALISCGANVKDADIQFRDTMIVAAMGGFTDIVRDLIELGVQVNSRDMEKNTPLHLACDNGHASTVKVLLEHQASVTAVNIHGKSPLHVAVDKKKTEIAVLMMEHASWEGSLSVRDGDGFTCMDKMIANTPEAVKIVLDKCVKRSKHDPTEENYTIEFNYRYIDPGPRDPMSRKNNYNAILKMLAHEREELLSHLLCQSLLAYKWRCFGRFTFAVDISIQTGFALLLTIFYVVMIKPNQEDYTCSWTNDTSNNSNEEAYPHGPQYRHRFMYALQYAIYGFLLALFFKEMKNAISVGCRYVLSPPFFMTNIAVILVAFSILPPGFEPCDAQWRSFAYATLIFLLRETIMIQRFETVGLYFTMFFEVFKTMLKIFILMLFFIVAWTVPLSIMLRQDGYDGAYALLSTLAMTVGELNFRDNFIRGDNTPFTYDLYGLFPFFCILMNLSLMNLMVGVAVGDISKVEKRAYLTRLRTQVSYLLHAEILPTMRLREWLHSSKLVVQPNARPSTKWDRVKRRFLNEEKIYFIKNKVKEKELGETRVDIHKEMENQRKKIDNLTVMMQSAMEVLTRLNQVVLNRQLSD
ncbi:transient receptor potential cation channel subfamily A member 1-like [Physella acuta]|uniref:transient receptor potential cation channel subfamily A member 1-like n=1 Tax=Physella acuta TaxID=109671 RepID=UPI0027DC4A49|nr:transient receptor potential cation channel subfamily A member 1-like [Physella acuta]